MDGSCDVKHLTALSADHIKDKTSSCFLNYLLIEGFFLITDGSFSSLSLLPSFFLNGLACISFECEIRYLQEPKKGREKGFIW